jgi:hypothetical protein
VKPRLRATPLRAPAAFFTLALSVSLSACDHTPGMVLDAAAAVDGAILAPPNVDAPPARAKRSDSGLAWLVLEEGTGATHPTTSDYLRVHYTGWQTDGTMFDSSVLREEPAVFPAGGLIDGWVEGLQLMTEGEIRRFWIPSELAYGDPPRREGAPGGMLVFDVQLIEIVPAPPPPPPAEDPS